MKQWIQSIFLVSCMILCSGTFLLSAAVEEIAPYNWGQNVLHVPSQVGPPGHQVLHFGSTDYPYQDSPEGREFVTQYLLKAKPVDSDADLLRFASDQVQLKGAYLELGVTTGKTINFIAALNSHQTIYGFDSFLGNPEDYEKDGHSYLRGTFGLKNPDQLPPVLSNVRLIKGPFDESIPYYVEKILNNQPIAFLHVDCDLYSSTHTALEVLAPYIQPGTIIVFDDFYGYARYEHFEYKALMEFLATTGYGIEYIAYNTMFEGVAVRITRAAHDSQIRL